MHQQREQYVEWLRSLSDLDLNHEKKNLEDLLGLIPSTAQVRKIAITKLSILTSVQKERARRS